MSKSKNKSKSVSQKAMTLLFHVALTPIMVLGFGPSEWDWWRYPAGKPEETIFGEKRRFKTPEDRKKAKARRRIVCRQQDRSSRLEMEALSLSGGRYK